MKSKLTGMLWPFSTIAPSQWPVSVAASAPDTSNPNANSAIADFMDNPPDSTREDSGRNPERRRDGVSGKLVPEERIELSTYPLPRGCATTTLLRHSGGNRAEPARGGGYSPAERQGQRA